MISHTPRHGESIEFRDMSKPDRPILATVHFYKADGRFKSYFDLAKGITFTTKKGGQSCPSQNFPPKSSTPPHP